MTTANDYRDIDVRPLLRQISRMGEWKKVGENLVRHWAGTIYLRAKVAGKPVRVSLETDDLRIAKLKRDDELAKLRQAAANEKQDEKCSTVGDAINIAEKRLDLPHLKTSTAKYYKALFATLRKTLPTSLTAHQWTAPQAVAWWKKQAAAYAPQRANNLLSLLKKTASVMIDTRARHDDPTKGLKRVKITKTEPELPGLPVLQEVIESIRTQGKRASEDSANFVAFLAYSGCRHGEAKNVEWKHVGKEWLTITGGAEGTKNRKTRRIPISESLRALLDAMHYEDASGPVLLLKSPRIALKNACKRLGIPHLRLHDLRHFFTTWCIEREIDIPTIARWLGHTDRGVLLMRTYGHLRDQHSLDQIKKLNG